MGPWGGSQVRGHLSVFEEVTPFTIVLHVVNSLAVQQHSCGGQLRFVDTLAV